MTNREYVKRQIDALPDIAIEKVIEFVTFQRFTLGLYDNDTDYLSSVPGMADKIKTGLKTPLADCVPLSEVWSDV
jgi:hypothetical protein